MNLNPIKHRGPTQCLWHCMMGATHTGEPRVGLQDELGPKTGFGEFLESRVIDVMNLTFTTVMILDPRIDLLNFFCNLLAFCKSTNRWNQERFLMEKPGVIHHTSRTTTCSSKGRPYLMEAENDVSPTSPRNFSIIAALGSTGKRFLPAENQLSNDLYLYLPLDHGPQLLCFKVFVPQNEQGFRASLVQMVSTRH